MQMCPDSDGDGVGLAPCGGDCNDNDRVVHPGVAESCNGVDDDCNGAIDDGANLCAVGPGQTAECTLGTCGAPTCSASFLDCTTAAGCETANDATNCGECAHACLHPTCTGGVCVADYVQIGSGYGHTCALRGSGTVECWGLNDFGQLGNGTMVDSATPVAVTGLTDAVAISVGKFERTNCALRSDATVVCWGRNQRGQVGDNTGTYANVLTPVPVTGLTDVVEIAAGSAFTCARRSGGDVMCWGYGGEGQLGNGATNDSLVPVAVTGLVDAAEVEVGDLHVCARREDQTVVCWGGNVDGQLGDGSTTDRDTPTPVSGIANATGLAVGASHTCVRRADDTVSCWGLNANGQLGDGSLTTRLTPVTADSGLPNPVRIEAGGEHTCARGSTGIVRCWGENGSGQLGDGMTTDRRSGVRVMGLDDATRISVGWGNTCALRETGQALCWGQNNFGQVGDGTMTTAYAPVAVTDP
jgi:alpha-tubulin suppressor-like RCC1 family protein